MSPATVAELRAWSSLNAAGSTAASVTVALWMGALRNAGVAIDEEVMCLINCRRYLGAKHRYAHGNFAVGMRMPLPPWPTDITTMVRRVSDSGWPAANLGYAELATRLRRRTETDQLEGAYVSNRLRLIVSDLGKLTMFDGVAWAKDERPPQMTAFLQPNGADAITLLVSEFAGGRTFTGSFCSEMIEPAVIEDALTRMSADPIGVLQASLPGS